MAMVLPKDMAAADAAQNDAALVAAGDEFVAVIERLAALVGAKREDPRDATTCIITAACVAAQRNVPGCTMDTLADGLAAAASQIVHQGDAAGLRQRIGNFRDRFLICVSHWVETARQQVAS